MEIASDEEVKERSRGEWERVPDVLLIQKYESGRGDCPTM